MVKLYADEPGSREVRSLKGLAVSVLARVEVTAAFWRMHRSGELSAVQARVLSQAFEADLWGGTREPRFIVMAVTEQVLDDAVAAVATHGLRAYDAVQLASAIGVRMHDPACSTFVSFDRKLQDAAASSGFAVLPRG